MFRKSITHVSLFFLLTGCMAKPGEVNSDDGGVSGVDGGQGDPDGGTTSGVPPVVESSKARLSFKGGARYATLLSQGLDIPRDQLCRELGLYDCVDSVHRIALLGVEPYKTGVIEPLDNTAVSTPFAVERIALSACSTWAARSNHTDRRASITSLYRGLLQRDPEEREFGHLEALHADMSAIGDPALNRSWGTMSCFAVATTLEALFY